MKTIILSAGQGTRLLPLTKSRPKCLLEVAEGLTILDWQLIQLADAGVEEVVVVTGYGSERVDQQVVNHRERLNVRTLLNPGYDQMDNLGSAWHAREEMDGEFIILNGDTLFVAPVVERLCQAAPVPVRTTISRKSSFDSDDMKVILDGDRLEAIGKTLDPSRATAESIGMILFRGEGVDRFRDAACAAMSEHRKNGNRYYLSLIDAIAKTDRVDLCEAAQHEWGEVDFPRDLEAARARLRRWQAGSKAPEGNLAKCQPDPVALQPAAGVL